MKRKLLFAVMTLITGAWSLSANAQQEPVSGTAYYLYNVETGTFMTRGDNWGTRAVSYPVGLPWQVTINNGVCTLRMYDLVTDGSSSGLGDNGFSDNGSPISLTLEGDANGYKLKFGSNYVTADAGGKAYTINVNGASTGNSTWQFLTVDEFKAKLDEKKIAQDAAVATAAGLNLAVTTVDALANELSTWAATDKTSSITNAGITSATGWTYTGVTNRGGNPGYGSYGTELYQCSGTYSQTVSGLTPGIYKVGIKAQLRAEGWGTCNTVGAAGYVSSDAFLTANGNVVQIKDWYSGKTGTNNPDNTGQFTTRANAGFYYSEVFCYVGTDGKLSIAATSESYWGGKWFIFGGVTLTQYVNNVSQEQADALLAEVAQYENAAVPAQALSDMATAKAAFQADQSVTNYQALSDALQVVKDWVNAYASAKAYLDRMAETLDNTNFYTAAAYETYYGQWKTKYEAGTLTMAEASGLTADLAWNTGWHSSNNIDDVLLSSWTIGGAQAHDFDTSLYINTWSTEDNNNGFAVPFFEYWVGSGSLASNTIQATLVGLTAGQLYSVTMLARIQTSGTKVDNSIRLQVGAGSEVDLTTGDQILSTNRYMKTFTALGEADANGNLTITITVDDNSNISWLSFKNAKYEAIDDARIPYAEQLAAKVAEAQGLASTLVVPAGVTSALTATANTYDGKTYTSYETIAEFETAIAAVQTAIDDATAAEASYAQYQTLHGYAQTLLATPYVDLVADAHATYAAAVTEPTLNTKADIDAALTALNAATLTYVENADPAAGSQFDLTFWLINPDVTSFWTGAWEVVPDGWYTDQTGSNFQVMANEEMGPGGEVFIEHWTASAKTSGFVLYQKATLPEGTYKMTGRVGLLQDTGGNNANMTFSANETDGSQIAVGTLADQEVEFINTTTQEVKIGIKAHPGNSYRWIGINKIHMYKLPTDNTTYAITVAATNATVAVTVGGVAANEAKKLDAVNYTITLDENCTLETHTVTYVDGDNNTQTITPTDLGEGNYTFQMPAYPVTITVVATVDKSALAAAIAGAEPYLNEALPTTIMTALNNAYSDAQTVYNDTDATAAQVSAATDALNFAVMDVQAAIPYYAAYLELKAYADALVQVANDNATANTALATAISDAVTAVTNAAGSGDIDVANTNLRAAMDTYAADANPVGDGAKFNLTYKFVNPNLEGLPTWQGCDGWYTEQPDGNSQVMTNDAATSEDGTKTAFYEYWSYTAKSNNLFTLYQPVTLPEGYYQMTCYAFAKQQDDPANTGDVKGLYFYANDTQGSVVDTDRLSYKEIEFKNRASQEVKIGLKATNPNSYNWMGIGYLELYKIPSKAITIDPDDDDYDYTLEGAYDVTLYRPIKEGYNSIVLPFSMTQQEVEDAFGQDSKISILKAYNGNTQSLSFTRQEGIVANRPCLLKATQAFGDSDNPYEFFFEGRTLVAYENNQPTYQVRSENGEANMVGTYATQIDVPQYCWFVQNGSLVYADALDCWINLTRAYIELKDAEGNGWTPAGGAVKFFFDDEEATGIAAVENGELKLFEGQAYDLSGRAVKNPTKGLYIIDGKKVFLK